MNDFTFCSPTRFVFGRDTVSQTGAEMAALGFGKALLVYGQGSVVRTGVLLEVQDTDETWVGMVVGVRIDAQRQGRALSVRQHLTIERQYR